MRREGELCDEYVVMFFFFKAEDGIRVLVRSRGLGNGYRRQGPGGGSSKKKTCAVFFLEDPPPRSLLSYKTLECLPLIHI